MTMQCSNIKTNATGSFNQETGEIEWSGENTMTINAVDDITNEEEELTVPFRPVMLGASPQITEVVGMNPGGDQNAEYMQNYNNMWWACAVAINQWPEAKFVVANDQIEVQVNDTPVAYINAIADLTPVE